MQLLLDVLALAWPVGTEFLDLLSPQFISDLVVSAITRARPRARATGSWRRACRARWVSVNGTDGGLKVASVTLSRRRWPPTRLWA